MRGAELGLWGWQRVRGVFPMAILLAAKLFPCQSGFTRDNSMAIYTTFFLCEPSELCIAFPGWRLPCAEPVRRARLNPFTGEEITVETREPDWDDVESVEESVPQWTAVEIQGDYETYLERRIPEFVQSHPHWCAKGLTTVELEPLILAATGEEKELQMPLHAHPSANACLEEFPAEFVTKLKAADESALTSIAESWAKEMSTPDYTHNGIGERIYDDWTVEDALRAVRPLVELVRRHVDGQSMYLLSEW